MDKFNIALLVDVKQEYTIQLIQLLYLQIYSGIKSIYDAAREYCEQSKDNNILKRFQQLLAGVPKWNTDKIQEEFKRIEKNTDCDWLEDLLTAVFVSHTKVLTAIQIKNNGKKTIQLNVPEGPYFIHKCYIEVAREFWKRPFLMSHQLSNIDLQRNLAESEKVIRECIHETVRRMLPVRSILKEYLGNDYKDEEINDEDITSNISLNTKNNLRKLVQREIEQTLSKKDEPNILEGGVDDSIKQVEIPKGKKLTHNKNEDYTVSKVDVTIENKVDDKLEKELIDAITNNNEVSTTIVDESKSFEPNEMKEEEEVVKNEIVVDKKEDEDIEIITQNIQKIQDDIKSQLAETHPIDVFTVPENTNVEESVEIPIIKKSDPIDIFSFFEDAAPYSR